MQTVEYVDLLGDTIIERVSEARRKPTTPNGYAGSPGRGPAGETCRSCQHKRSTGSSTARTYWKCGLMQAHWTGGPGTDIRMRSPACQFWAREQGE
ncbi:hypothetical protein ACXIVK_27775 [Paraburkholderia caledonica]|jgi:hypothetical protein